MKIIDDNYTVTTVYFDGQFWCALIEQSRDGKVYSGRYVFGSEPTNPRMLQWMLNEFTNVPLLPIEKKSKIRFKKLAKKCRDAESSVQKSLIFFSKAQKEYAEKRKENWQAKKDKYLKEQLKKKNKK